MEISVKVKMDVPGNRLLDASARKAVLTACGAKLKWLTRQNFGQSGKTRPTVWPGLSKRYARRVNRPYATLYATGELFGSIRMTPATDGYVEVFTEDRKAAYHQFGQGKNPARPFFPIRDGDLTPSARREVEWAAKLEVEKMLRKL